MSGKRVLLCFNFVPLQIAVILVVSYLLVNPPHVHAQVSQRNKVRELQEQRLATLRILADLTADHYKSGLASSDEVLSATRAKDEAQLELCDSNKERIATLERIVVEAKLLEDQEAKLAANKLLPETSLLKATANRLRQE